MHICDLSKKTTTKKSDLGWQKGGSANRQCYQYLFCTLKVQHVIFAPQMAPIGNAVCLSEQWMIGV